VSSGGADAAAGGAPDPVPEWPEGTAAVLTTTGDGPHAIPVSTAVRTGERTVHLALGRRRESLARLRADPRCALTVMAGPDVAFTLHGRATVVADDVAGTVGVRLDVEAVQDHMTRDFTIEDGVRWRWTADKARERDAAVRAGLRDLRPSGP
jgi:hypothetical protein